MKPLSPFLVYNSFAKQAIQFRSCGMKRREIFAKLIELGYDKSQKSLDRHIQRFEANGSALVEVKKTGKLNAEQLEDLHAWILDQNRQNNPLKRDDVQRYIYETWAIQVTPQCVSKYLRVLRLTLRTCQTKTSGHKKLNSVLRDEYWNFITKLKKDNTMSIPAAQIHSIDVTYTKKPIKLVTTFAPKGSPKPKSAKKVKLYTNAIVTMINASGKNLTPCVMFTFDPKMGPGTNGPVGKAKRAHFLAMLDQYGIAEERVIYKKSKKNLYAESPDMYELFLKRYKLRLKVGQADLIFHDGGKAFKR